MTPGLILVGLGLVLVIEGLMLALFPSLYDQIINLIREMPHETRRRVGLIAIACGVALVWVGRF